MPDTQSQMKRLLLISNSTLHGRGYLDHASNQDLLSTISSDESGSRRTPIDTCSPECSSVLPSECRNGFY
jgi:hypothetical protein